MKALLRKIVGREHLPQGAPRRSTGHRSVVTFTWPRPLVRLELECGHVVDRDAYNVPKHAVRCAACAAERA